MNSQCSAIIAGEITITILCTAYQSLYLTNTKVRSKRAISNSKSLNVDLEILTLARKNNGLYLLYHCKRHLTSMGVYAGMCAQFTHYLGVSIELWMFERWRRPHVESMRCDGEEGVATVPLPRANMIMCAYVLILLGRWFSPLEQPNIGLVLSLIPFNFYGLQFDMQGNEL